MSQQQVWKFEFDKNALIWAICEGQHTREAVGRSLREAGLENLALLPKRDEVFSRILTEKPLVILCDVDASNETILDFLKDIRVSVAFPSIPILPLMTVSHWKQNQMSLFPYGLLQFAEKPLTAKEIIDKITLAIQNFQKSELERTLKTAKEAFSQSNFVESQSLFQEAKRFGNSSLPTEIGLITIHQRNGNFKEAEKLSEQALKLDKDSFSLQLLGVSALINMRTLSERSQAMLEGNVKSLLRLCHYEERWVQLLDTLSAKSDFFLHAFEKHRAEFSQHPRALFEAAKIYFGLKREDTSLVCAEQALAGGLQKVELYNLLGVLLRRGSSPEKALAHYASAVHLAPQDHRVHYNRGLALEELGQPLEAMASFKICLSLKPDFLKAKERIDHLTKASPR